MPTNLYEHLTDPRSPLDAPQRLLAVGAHPDDIEFGAGATIARWTAAGAVAVFAVVTDGSKGTWDPEARPVDVAAERRIEAERGAASLGAHSVAFLDRIDGELEYSLELRGEIAQLIRQHRPDVVLSHDPWQRYQLHPDHRVTGLAAVDAVVAARDPQFFPEHGLASHRPAALLLWSADVPDHVELVAPAAMDRKIEALLCHISQAESTMGNAQLDAAARERFASRIVSWSDEQGAVFDVGPAETFKRITP